MFSSPDKQFASISIKDLLDARDAYHLHLMAKRNVVGTAIGRYRIERGDYYADHPPEQDATPHAKPSAPRTLLNSVVRPWSWSCVLVFVDVWQPRDAFAGDPDQMVPARLYLADGRIVPTCVVLVERDLVAPGSVARPNVPLNAIGGGCAVLSYVQGKEHVGTIGCLVSDGATVYALTNRHVAGPAGHVAYTTFRGKSERIGVSSAKSLGKLPFTDAYHGWAGTDTVVNLDAGLIEIDDLDDWTPNILGIGPLGDPLDLSPGSLTLDLIETPVFGYGAASQALQGTIAAFFYRYRALGGREDVADFLIAPVGNVSTRPGDSGTVWCLSTATGGPARPFAMQWGGHMFVDAGQKHAARGFALASSLGTIFRELDLELVRSWQDQLPEYWGDVGHYTIAAKACSLVTEADCFTLVQNNLDRISYNDDQITPATFKGLSTAEFVPLADVPDKVWKMHGAGARGGPEHPNHFADMDKPDEKNGGKTLLDITSDGRGGTNPATVRIATFNAYYGDVAEGSKGCLPFRVWQLFEIMLAARSEAEWLCAAGTLAHYVGDACQPLHISYLFDGTPEPDGSVSGKGVHSAYESKMVGLHAGDIVTALNTTFKIDKNGRGVAHGLPDVRTGEDAAVAVVQLMRETFAVIAPQEIVDAYVANPATSALWDRFGDRTIAVLELGCRRLAQIWDGAWRNNPNAISTKTVGTGALSVLYLDAAWAPSKTLATIGSEITGA